MHTKMMKTKILTLEEWYELRKNGSSMFRFWAITLELEILLNMYVQSLRSGNFDLYCDCLTKMCPWCFVMARTNYARWLPVHLRDMTTLHNTHPEIAREFRNGNFVVQKSCRTFSSVAIDQAHEQFNAIVKGDGGAVGLTENPSALRQLLVPKFQE